MQLINAARRLNLTYRKVDHWANRGYIRAHYEDKHGLPVEAQFAGTGYVRVISFSEFEVLRAMVHLVNGGVKPEHAAKYARQLLSGRPVRFGPYRLEHA